MPPLAEITTSGPLAFGALVAGEVGGPPVLWLQGFAELMHRGGCDAVNRAKAGMA